MLAGNTDVSEFAAKLEQVVFDRSLNHLPVELIDCFADTISKVVPRSSRRSVSTPEPLHGFIELCFFKPCRRRTSPFEVLIEHHLQQHQRVIGHASDASVQLIEGLAIHAVERIEQAIEAVRSIT